ncbi:tail fiber domain-containing protein [Brachybacterium halotolerans subsp. kimchii]|uniref:tail fiber domain-containing protein n=1 Tax=Brachybacterium halotolerans TaxID=2795215 RepID=UPI001E4DB1B1|nr:tail fiber domain-containing protein [Brachybacterium halotolerans]UEJ82635.1 tail fiber domain-containing protein [Brachybacterium halotolerans subsp. kimchii]
MVRRTNLRPDPAKAMAELVKRLQASGTDKNTTPTGVKDLGARGDVVWTDSNGNEIQSMRELSTEMGQVSSDLSYLNGTILPQIKNATYIDDNSITTRLIAANAVGADQIIANSITGDKIRANSIAAEKILGGSFEGKQFIGGDFIGAIFRTSETSVGGAIRIDKTYGIRGWDKDGTRTFLLDPDTGAVQIAATLRATDSAGSGVMLEPKTALGTGGLFFTSDGKHNSKTAGVFRDAYSDSDPEDLLLRGANGGGVYAYGSLATNGAVSATGTVNGKDVFARKWLYTADPPSSSTATNAAIGSDGAICKKTSSARYKRNISPFQPDAKRVLALEPRQWQHRDPNFPERIEESWTVGFVAEEVEAAGLRDLVIYAGDGKGGWRPDALNYDGIGAAQQVVLQDHDSRVAALEARVTELEGRLTDG